MNLYCDTEFNGHGGYLMSLALVGDDGSHWYGVWPPDFNEPLDPWVAEHVLPKLFALPETIAAHGDNRRASLIEYLVDREPPLTIWADWPDDFAHLMRLMSGPSYVESQMIPCTMQLIMTPEGEPKPERPHNALSDAIALMRWHRSVNP